MLSDPISDLLTRIRNASRVFHSSVEIPYSKLKLKIIEILCREGYFHSFKVIEISESKKTILISLKYAYIKINDGSYKKKPAIQFLKRKSKPSCRVYVSLKQIPRILNNLGSAIISTSKGLKTDKEAKEERLGGEFLCYVY